MCLGGIWALIPCSMEPKHYFCTSLKGTTFFSPDHTETFRSQNGRIQALQKSLGYAILWDF